MVLLFALTVMRTCPAVTYQFLPLRSNVAKSSRMKHRQKFTTSWDSVKLRFFLIRSAPNGVVCKSVILNGYSAVGHIINPSRWGWRWSRQLMIHRKFREGLLYWHGSRNRPSYHQRSFLHIHYLRSPSIVLFLDCVNPFWEPFVNEVESGKHKYSEDKLGGVCQHIMFPKILIAQGNDCPI